METTVAPGSGQIPLPTLVIIGGGFGGLETAKALRRARARVILLDRNNHYLFQPLLYQVATAALSPADIAQPLRHILRHQTNLEILMTQVDAVDPAARSVRTSDGDIPYDYLIIAAGARHSYFGHPEWERFAPGLKGLEDALEIRRRMLLAFEIAEKTRLQSERDACMTFVVIGAGPTGVEMAGAIAEIARVTLVRDFRHINSAQARVILLEGGPRVLPMLEPALSQSASGQLTRIGVELRLGAVVSGVSAEGVSLQGGEKITARTIIWAAGNAASPLGASLGVPLDRQGRVMVNADLSIPGHPEVMVIGDMAHLEDGQGRPLPGVSPVAMQEGRHAARNLMALMAGQPTSDFHYTDRGTMATIGRHAAVARIGAVRLKGYPAWLAWLFIHLMFLVGFRNKLFVLISWGYAYITMGRGARLITQEPKALPE